MSESHNTTTGVPRWVHAGASLAVLATFVLLIIGQMVTSFHAGMADPVWPTEPWYLFNNPKLEFNYLVEHTHRIAGFTVGVFVIALVLGIWWTEPRTNARRVAIAGLVILVAGYGEFHRGLMAQRNVLPSEIKIPIAPSITVAVGLAVLLAVVISGLAAGVRQSGLRLLASAALVAVMIQGLLGGFRVQLDALFGTRLAAIHGIFAQIVLSLLVILAVATERPPAASPAGESTRSLGRWAIALTVLVFVQIVWGAIVRHQPTPLMQRLHFLTAFLAVAGAVLLLRAVLASPAARSRSGLIGWVLGGLLILQLVIGVEAWMMKFGAYLLPEEVKITPEYASIRTLHALIGSGILASCLTLAVRLSRTIAGKSPKPDGNEITWAEPLPVHSREVELAARFREKTL